MDDREVPVEVSQLFHLLEKVAPEILARRYGPYDSETEARAATAAYVSRLRKVRLGPHECMYPGCDARAIAKSHVLPRRGVVDVIAEDGHVSTPRANAYEGRLEVALVGVSGASVFAGFCNRHEQAFGRFERQSGELSLSDAKLQLFRTACREVRHTEILLAHLAESWFQALELYESRAKGVLRKNLDSAVFDVSAETLDRITSIRIERPEITRALDLIATRYQALEDFRKDIYAPLERYVLDDQSPFSIACLEIDERVPLCLAGQGSFHVDAGDGVQKVSVVLNIWPRDSTTLLLLGANSRHAHRIPYYLRELTASPPRMLRAIEAWALHGSDHWFVSPSHWRSLTDNQQMAVLDALKDTSRSLAHAPECMLFPAIHERLRVDGVS